MKTTDLLRMEILGWLVYDSERLATSKNYLHYSDDAKIADAVKILEYYSVCNGKVLESEFVPFTPEQVKNEKREFGRLLKLWNAFKDGYNDPGREDEDLPRMRKIFKATGSIFASYTGFQIEK